MSEPKIRIQVNVYENGTVVGSDNEGQESQVLEFDDFVRGIQGLVGWAAGWLTETNDESEKEIGSAMLIAALYEWTFSDHEHDDVAPEDDGFQDDDADPMGLC